MAQQATLEESLGNTPFRNPNLEIRNAKQSLNRLFEFDTRSPASLPGREQA
jgi:hypothetical protein